MTAEHPIAVFLKARYDEAEQTARRIKNTRHGALIIAPGDGESPSVIAIEGDALLADIESKRQIMAIHAARTDPCDAHDASFETIPCDTLLLLASPFSDHPDYPSVVISETS